MHHKTTAMVQSPVAIQDLRVPEAAQPELNPPAVTSGVQLPARLMYLQETAVIADAAMCQPGQLNQVLHQEVIHLLIPHLQVQEVVLVVEVVVEPEVAAAPAQGAAVVVAAVASINV